MLNLMKMVRTPVLKEMLFTGRPISADRALTAGALNYVVPASELEQVVYDLAARIAESSPLCVAVIKEERGVGDYCSGLPSGMQSSTIGGTLAGGHLKRYFSIVSG